MFSVPESMAIFAPEESANHSTGTPRPSARSSAAITRRHSGSASEPSARVGSPSRTTRSMPSGWRSVRLRTSPTTMLAVLVAGGRSTGTSSPSSSRSCSTNSPAGIAAPGSARCGASSLTISAGCTVPRRRAETIRCAPSSSGCSGSRRRVVELDHDAAPGRVEDPQHAVALGAVLAHAHAQLDHLEPEPGGQAREAADDLARLVGREVHRRPRVEQQRGSTAAARAAGGATGRRASPRTPGGPSARARAARRCARLVAHRREVAHLGEGDEPLVARVLARGARNR